MSRFALDILGTAMLGQSFGAIEGSFDDTYRRGKGLLSLPKQRAAHCLFLLLVAMHLLLVASIIYIANKAVCRQYQTVMAELMNPIYLLFPVLERLPLPRNLRYKAAVNHMYGVLEGFLVARSQCAALHCAISLKTSP